MKTTETVVIGAGPSGLFAAIQAAEKGERVVVLERNKEAGKKLLLTGESRCNLTSTLPPDQVLDQVFQDAEFLYSSLYTFPPARTRQFFSGRGLKLKEERGSRIYPENDSAESVRRLLVAEAEKAGVNIIYESRVEEIIYDSRCRGVRLQQGDKINSDRVILAAGGCSYPWTGSDGSGYTLAQKTGHSLCPEPAPALVPLKVAEDWPADAAGLKLKNTGLKLKREDEVLFTETGEIELRENELGGAAVLAASCYFERGAGKSTLIIDLKPGLDKNKLDDRLKRDFDKFSNKLYRNAFKELLPAWLRPVVVKLSEIPGDKRINQITAGQREALADLLKHLQLRVTGTSGFKRAIITRGGVSTDEIDPSTMESKILSGLYFAGEILAPAAHTGGHNLQIAFSTAYLAAAGG